MVIVGVDGSSSSWLAWPKGWWPTGTKSGFIVSIWWTVGIAMTIVRLHHSTIYVDGAFCYTLEWCGLSLCHNCETCKNGWTDQDAIWVMGLDGPKELCIRWGSRSPIGKDSLGKGPIVKYRDFLPWAVKKMAGPVKLLFGMLSRVDSRNYMLDGVQIPRGKGNFEGEGKGCPMTLWRENYGFACGLGLAEGSTSSIIFARLCQCAIMSTCRIPLNHPSVATMRPYVKLLWPLVNSSISEQQITFSWVCN